MSAQRKHKTLSAFLSYLKGELSPGERHALERDLEADAFEKEAMEGFERIAPGDLEEDLLSLHTRMHRRLKRRRRMALYGIAATVASILVVGTIFINIYDFNPEDDRESAPTGESLVREQIPEAGKPEPAVVQEAETDKELAAEAPETDKGAETDRGAETEMAQATEKKLEAPVLMEEVPVADQDREMDVLDAEVPELEEEVAPAPEAEPVTAVEAAPTRRQKRAMSKAQPMPSRADQMQAAEASSGQVSGVVVSSEDLDPLPGASVFRKDSDSGVVTDLQGRFTVPAGEGRRTTVVASYVGMETEEYQLDPERENTLVMQPDLSTLDEVVVIAYGARDEQYPVSAVQQVQVHQKEYESAYAGAEPVGGIQAYKMYMEKNIRFPAGDTLNQRGVVVLTFTVNPDGSLSGIQTLRSPGEAYTEEAVRLLEEGPPWNPARDESGTIDEVVRMRIVFKK